MTCPFGASSVTVAASNNGSGFSPTTDLQINVTDFSMTPSPASATLPAGQSAAYALSLWPQNGPYQSAITLSCDNGNLPPGAACAFDPPTVTPGASGAGSRVTISTTATSMMPPLATGGQRHDAPGFRLPAFTVPPVAWAALVAVLWLSVRRREQRRRRLLTAAAVSLALAGVAGQFTSTRVGATPVSAAGMASGIALFPSTVTFGNQTVGTTSPAQLVSLTNIGADTLNIAGIVAAGDFSQVNNCGTSVASGGSCAVAVSFAPTAAGSRTGTISVVDDAPGSPHTVSLTGTGVAVPTTSGGTPSGTYVVTISGTSGTLTHTATVTVVVQ